MCVCVCVCVRACVRACVCACARALVVRISECLRGCIAKRFEPVFVYGIAPYRESSFFF